MGRSNGILRCDMEKVCIQPVSHIDEKGFVYCASHGATRQRSGVLCRKLRPAEIKRLERGEAIRYYSIKTRSFETTVRACAHDVTVRWWDITGRVTDERLEEVAEEFIRAGLAKDQSQAHVFYDMDDGHARGWWGVPGTETS